MEKIRTALKTLGGNWILLLPTYVARLIPALLSIFLFTEMSEDLSSLLSVEEIGETQYVLENYWQVTRDFYEANQGYIVASMLVGLFGLVLNFVAMPATFGMVKQSLMEDEKPSVSQILPNAGKYFLKYLLYRISKFALWILVFLVGIAIFAGVAFVGSMIDEAMAVLLLMLLGLIFILGIFALHLILKLWFPAMVLEETGVFDGLQQAFQKSKVCFWPLFAGFLGVSVIGWIGNMLVNLFIGDVQLLDLFLTPVIPGIVTVILMIYYFLLYQESKEELVKSREEG